MRHHSPTRKKLIVCLSSILAGCTQAPASLPACHQFTHDEKVQQYQADLALPHDNPLHAIVRDWERLCK